MEVVELLQDVVLVYALLGAVGLLQALFEELRVHLVFDVFADLHFLEGGQAALWGFAEVVRRGLLELLG